MRFNFNKSCIYTGLAALALCLSVTTTHAQGEADTTSDLLSLLGEDESTNYTMATFKSTRVINGQSIENVAGGVMDFRISHRFGMLNSGAGNAFGLDQASMRLAFEYGITDRLMVGLGRSNVNKEVDAFAKFKLLRQSTGKKKMPISLSLFTSIVDRTAKWQNPDRQNFYTSRLYYCNQILIGRKFNERLSLQLSPTMVHRNLIATNAEKHDVYAAGIGGRYKFTVRTSINFEYFYLLPNQVTSDIKNSFSLGFDIETGGHVFQLHVTNSTPMNDKGFISETKGSWGKGDLMFGFNISRVFTIKEKKKETNGW
jgi:Membrane bound beta barrel domain (DUF5777)